MAKKRKSQPPAEGSPERNRQQGDGEEVTAYMTLFGPDGKPLFQGKAVTGQHAEGEIVGVATGEDYVPPPEPQQPTEDEE